MKRFSKGKVSKPEIVHLYERLYKEGRLKENGAGHKRYKLLKQKWL